MVCRMPSKGDFKIGQTAVLLQREFYKMIHSSLCKNNQTKEYVKDC